MGYLPKCVARTDGYFAVVVEETEGNEKEVFIQKCDSADQALSVAVNEAKRLRSELKN